MRWLLVLLVACGSKQTPPPKDPDPTPPPSGVVKDTRTELEKRRDAGCEQLGPRLTACAVEDAKKDVASGKTKQADFEKDTSPDVQKANTAKFVKECESKQMSSRQVRVLEVCFKEAPDCKELDRCLANLQPQAK